MGRSFLYKGIGKTFVCKYFACNRTVCSRIVSGLITGSLLMGLYGCGATENTTVSDTQKQESSQEDLEPVTFTFYNADGMEDTWTDPVAQKITEKTGVTLKIDYPADASDNRIALMVATGEYPDLVFAKGDAPTLIQNDALIDMSDLIDEYGPNIKNCMEMSTKICVIPVMIHLFTSYAVTRCRKKHWKHQGQPSSSGRYCRKTGIRYHIH